MHITVQTLYKLQYLTMQLIVYMNSPTGTEFLTLFRGMENIMHHSHGTIIYSRNKLFKNNEIPIHCLFKSGKSDIKQTQK